MLSDMVTEGVPQSGVPSQYATNPKRNPLWVEGPVKESDRFLVWNWRCRNGRGAAFDKWEFGLTQLLDALGADPRRGSASRPISSNLDLGSDLRPPRGLTDLSFTLYAHVP